MQLMVSSIYLHEESPRIKIAINDMKMIFLVFCVFMLDNLLCKESFGNYLFCRILPILGTFFPFVEILSGKVSLYAEEQEKISTLGI